jgi:hypothetical protein
MFLKSFTRIRTASVTVSGTPVVLATDHTLTNGIYGGRTALEVNNVDGSGTVYVGDKDVTESTGLPVPQGEYRIFPVQGGSEERIYGVGSGDVIIAEYC